MASTLSSSRAQPPLTIYPLAQMDSACGPLRILVLHGEGVEATSTLLELDSHLNNFAKQNRGQKPRPCDVFDCIAGIGVGGWLALLLGRFRMDVTSCLSEWYKIRECISPKSTREMIRMNFRYRRSLHTDRLIEQVNHLTKVYRVGEYLFETDPQDTRTRHVFVAAMKSDQTEYCLFRAYGVPQVVASRDGLREGPKDPEKFKIAHAFGVTVATKHLTSPWPEQMTISGHTEFRANDVFSPHDVGQLAMDEMLAIYGESVPTPEIVNIKANHAKDLPRKKAMGWFSRGSSKLLSYFCLSRARPKSPEMRDRIPDARASLPTPAGEMAEEGTQDDSRENVENSIIDQSETNPGQVQSSRADRDSNPSSRPAIDLPLPDDRMWTPNSMKDRGTSAKTENKKSWAKNVSATKLGSEDPTGSHFRLSNGSSACTFTSIATSDCLRTPRTPNMDDRFRVEKNDRSAWGDPDLLVFGDHSCLSSTLPSVA